MFKEMTQKPMHLIQYLTMNEKYLLIKLKKN